MSFDDELPAYEQLREFEPLDWPLKKLVDQDNMGDWSPWLSQFDGCLQGILLDPASDVASLAEDIAVEYIAECREQASPLPADFADSDEHEAAEAADLAAIIEEFKGYLRAWQTAIATNQKSR